MNIERLKTLFPLLVVIAVSYFTYFRGYDEPPYFFWDENYHVAHAQKYLNGIYFMEPHPPLGKMLIALGEKLLAANPKDDQFIGTDYGRILPPGFSFAGYRLFPALLGWLTAPVLYFVFLLIMGSPIPAMLLSFLYVFDNALLVHGRGAMLESPQIFFIACTLLCFMVLMRLSDRQRWFWWASALMGLSFAGVMTTKVNGLVLILLWPTLAVHWWGQHHKLLRFAVASLAAFVVVYLAVWHLHFSIGKTVNPALPDQGYYQASPEYRQLLNEGRTSSWTELPVMLRDSLKFVGHYEKGVPTLNLCKSEENGSLFYMWPVGARTINYRWERNNNLTRYLYLIANPAVWLASLLGVLAGAGILFALIFLPVSKKPRDSLLLGSFMAMYAGYMCVMAMLDRVMYLYHYFMPLLFGFLMLAIVIVEIERIGPVVITLFQKTLTLAVGAATVILLFDFFSPLTYYKPISDINLKKRAWLNIWDVRCPSCPLTNGLATPVCDPKVKPSPDLYISGVRAESGTQDWGEPKMNRSVEDQELILSGVKYEQGLGVHANSSFKFRTRKDFRRFTALVGIPDYVLQKSGKGSVVFEVLADGRSVWKSPILHAGDQPVAVDVAIDGVDVITLVANDGGDGIDNDHACWLNPQFAK